MKKILLLGLMLIIPTLTFAENTSPKSKLNIEQCKEVLGAAIFNGVLEDVCGFTGSVKDNLKKIYDAGQCRYTVPQSNVDALIKDVLEDSRMRYKAFGEKVFCEENMKGYTDLMD